jgi:hypothetical protein
MRFLGYIDETDESIRHMTNWEFIDYFNSLSEVFDSKGNIQIARDDSEMFTTIFKVNGTDYYFYAKNDKNGTYSILFFPKGSDSSMFELTKKFKYAGDVFGGVFQSIRLLVKKYNVTTITFKSDNLHKPLYDQMVKWIEKRFPFKLESNSNDGNMTVYMYKRIQ